MEFDEDGKIDYSDLSVSQLRQARSNIASEEYPKNFANLLAELERREALDESADAQEPMIEASEDHESIHGYVAEEGNVEELAQGSSQLALFGYSLILPVVWLTGGYAVVRLGSGEGLGFLGTIVVFALVAYSITWLYVWRYGRPPNKRESLWLFIYCTIFAALLEAWGLLVLLAFPEEFSTTVPSDVAGYVYAFAILFDGLFLYLAFCFWAPKVGRYLLEDKK